MLRYLPYIAALVLGLGLLAFAIYKLRWVQSYFAYWYEASQDKSPNSVSAKRAVYIHSAAVSIATVIVVLAKAKWVFSRESLDAFETVCYCTVGGYIFGKATEAISTFKNRKAAPAPSQTGEENA